MSDSYENTKLLCEAARRAVPSISRASGDTLNRLLVSLASTLEARAADILAANRLDLSSAEANGVQPHMLDRLMLDEKRIAGIADALREVADLPNPIGGGERFTRPNGLVITRVRVPLGVVGIIYESRPNVTVDAASLCLKTGNAVVLRGGKEAIGTNRVLVGLIRSELERAGLDRNACVFIEDTSRDSSVALMKMRGLIDVLIPRGGKGLIKTVVENSTVPVIETGAGNCHLYVDESADLAMALRVALNAKLSRPAVCNSIETLLVHESVAADFLPAFADAAPGVELRCTPDALGVLAASKSPAALAALSALNPASPAAAYPSAAKIRPASDEDFYTEFDDLILSVKIVSSLTEAIDHINKYSTGHSEAIITSSLAAADRFQREIDSAAVYVNASTRFTDGGEFGFGAEIGITTQKLHARGPMGLPALTTVKYLVTGAGQVR